MRTRAAIHAAEVRGVRVACVEEGPLPLPGATRTLMIESNRSYYARTPEEMYGWFGHETCEARIAQYTAWFLETRATKGQAWGVGDWPMPSEYAGEPVGLGQLVGDASLFWCCPDACAAEEEIRADLAEHGGWWKEQGGRGQVF